MQNILLLIVGLILLVKGADLLVDGASAIAKKFKVSNLVIGLTVVAFGTSAPELAVNITSAISGNSDIAIGNIIGSNIANIFLILGISAAIYPLTVKSTTVWKEIPFSLLAPIVLFLLANDAIFDGVGFNTINRAESLVLLAFFAIFMYYTFGIARSEKSEEADSNEVVKMSGVKSAVYVLLGMAALVIGGNFLVESAVAFATILGISQSVIGLTVVAIGTSLPELATSAVAAYRKQTDIAIGNVVGSNIFNVFLILGITGTVTPLSFNPSINNADVLVAIAASLALFLFLFVGKRHLLQRWQGIVFVGIYIAYTISLFLR